METSKSKQPKLICDFDLAYAITGHKSQGSEWPIVIVLLDDSSGARRVCTREWIYTVASRAKQHLITIGKWNTIRNWLPNVGLQKRKTFLSEGIRDHVERRKETEKQRNREADERAKDLGETNMGGGV